MYWSPILRERYTQQLIQDRQLNPLEAARLRQQQQDEAAAGHTFWVAIYTWDEDWQDLDEANPTWTITFINDRGLQVAPTKISAISVSSAEIWQFFRSITPWSHLYEVRFPRHNEGVELIDSDTTWFMLHFSSILGSLNLRWELAAGARDHR